MHKLAVPSVALALVLPLATVAGPAHAAPQRSAAQERPAAQVQAPVPDLDWQPCPNQDSETGLLCTRADVPLDYDEPNGETITLDLLKDPATQPGRKIGTLFVNPGGPGGPSRDFAAQMAGLVKKGVSDRFDIVGIDPRGVGPSAPMRCATDERAPRRGSFIFPRTAKQARTAITFAKYVARTCRDGASPVVGNMSTADTARDMDLIRQAVGDDQLTYYGISYGSYLGSTYAAMFPDRVRALIVDSVLDPKAWATGRTGDGTVRPFTRRIGSGRGAYEAINSALRECNRVGKKRCPIAGKSARTYRNVDRYLQKRPIKVDGYRFTYDRFIATYLGSMYDPAAYRPLMRLLKQLHVAAYGKLPARQALTPADIDPRRALPESDHPFPGPYTAGPYGDPASHRFGRLSDPFTGVSCADTTNPSKPWTWWREGRRAQRTAPGYGPMWTWYSAACASWPRSAKEDRFTGPWKTDTSTPLLVVNNLHDPATAINGANAVHELFNDSRLVKVRNWGHGAIASGPCVDDIYARYLIDQQLPRDFTRCQPAKNIF